MKTKKFFMTSLLVMGMIIAKAAVGYPPELVLVSQPVLTYNANSVTIYYDVQNIGDYTYRGNLYIYLDPDNGYCFANEYMKVCPGSIRRIAVSIPAYRPNPSVLYTVMPYYELDNELYSFTTFEYFEPVRFCWYGYHNEPWVVIHVGPRPRHYTRPGTYRYYYDGYRPMMPPPPPGGHGPHPHDMPPMDPHHHTYGYHHNNGGYPANYHPDHHVPGYNHDGPDKPHGEGPTPGGHNSGNNSGSNPPATVVPHNGGNTPGSMSTNGASNTNNTGTSNGSGATTRPSSNSSNNSGTTARPSSNGSSSSSRGSSTTSSSSGRSSNSSGSSSGRSSSSSSSSRGSSSGSTRGR